MAKSLKDALVGAGMVRPEDTPEARSERSWRESQAKEAAELAEQMAAPPPTTPFEAPAKGVIVENPPKATRKR